MHSPKQMEFLIKSVEESVTLMCNIEGCNIAKDVQQRELDGGGIFSFMQGEIIRSMLSNSDAGRCLLPCK